MHLNPLTVTNPVSINDIFDVNGGLFVHTNDTLDLIIPTVLRLEG